MSVDLQTGPYFDDYDPSKRFHQILFKAGQTVQTRELNQIQDILNDQINSFGSHTFKNGSAVLRGDFTVQTKLKSIQYTQVTGTIPTTVDKNSPVKLVGASSGLEATVTKFTQNGAFFEIIKKGSNGEVDAFTPGETISLIKNSVEIASVVEVNQGFGSFARVEEGIYFIRGKFVRVEEQEIIMNEALNESSQIGFNVLEEVITSATDSSLFSNASGYPNENASGADRLKITLTLTKLDVNVDNPDFVRLALIETGVIEDISSRVEYSELERVLAQRTYEESGDYSVTPTEFEIREHLNDGSNGGVYTEAEGGDDTKLVAVIEPSIHYVRGYRVENDTERLIEFPKSRDTTIANNSVSPVQYGSIVLVENAEGVPLLNNNIEYNLRDNTGNPIGTMKVFTAKRVASNRYELAARDISFSVKGWQDVVSITAVDSNSSFGCTPVVRGIFGSSNESLIFNLPYAGVRTLQPNGSNDTTYNISQQFSITLNSNGEGVVTAPLGTQFTGSFSEFSCAPRDGSSGELNVSFSLSGLPIGSSLSISAGPANTAVNILAVLAKNVANARSKTLTTATQSFQSLASQRVYKLSRVDVVRIISLTIDGEDFSSSFKLNKNQTDYSYELSEIEAIASFPSGSLNIEYQYFNHGEGDYFSVDSYSGVDYSDIEGYTDSSGIEYDLRNCLDFRRTITASSVDVGSLVTHRASVRADIEYYLPRFVSLYVDADGKFGASVGVSDVSADKASKPENSMLLADLYVPSYTPLPESVISYPVDNKRFTMRDIGKIEKRVSNVEYTVSLNALEQSAATLQVVDPVTGGDRFKNGIFADPFLDFRLIDTDLSSASIDDLNGGILRPQVETFGVNMQYVSGGSVKDGMISAPITTTVSFSKQSFATMSINVNPHAVFSWAGFISLTPNRDFWIDTVYAPPKIINQTVNHRGATKEGVVYGKWARTTQGRFQFGVTQAREKTEVTFNQWTTSRSAGEDILSTSIIPFMRAVNITFTASGLRPFTRVYPWFGNREVSSLCAPVGQPTGSELVTDEQGNLVGELRIPNNSGFTTGEKSLILVDNKTNPNEPLERSTFATATFASSGTLVRRQRKTLVTRHLGLTKRKTIEYRRVDPIAQSFAIEQDGGLFCAGVDIFMKTKSTTIPLTVEIREMENGIPTDEVVARAVLQPSQVNISNDGSVSTRASFEPSVYLTGGEEYCVVLLANTQEYEAFIAEMGGTVIGSTSTVASQPHTGVFFTSSNGSTWSAVQTQDMKFNIVREVYDTAANYAIFSPVETDTSKLLESNPLKSSAGSNIIEIKYPAHGCKVGDSITLSGVLSDAGIAQSEINKTHLVAEVVDFDTVRISLTTNANSTLQFGGFEVVARGGILFHLLNVNIDFTDFERAKAQFEYRYRRQGSRTMSDWLKFTPGTDVLLAEEGSYRTTSDFEVRALLSSDGVLSPQVDTFGFTSTLTSFRVDPNLELFNYVTKPISLENPSTSGRFFIGGLLPSGANMKLYIKIEGSDTWEEINPDTSVASSSSVFTETSYNLGERDPFASFRLKVALTGSRTNPPVLRDIRGVVLA